MLYRNFGSTDLRASVVGFGVWTVSTSMWGVNDHETRIGLLQRAYELGITFYDTADVYGDGTGETILREAIGSHRDKLTIATKFGYDFYNFPGPQPGQRERPHDWSSRYIREAAEKSLQRLGTDYIDLYQLHNPRIDDIQNDEIFETLESLREAGKIRHYGVALGPAIDIRQETEGVEAFELRDVASVQIIFNVLEQMLGPKVFAAAMSSHGGVMCRIPHASGLLEGVYTTDTEFAPNDHRQFRVKTSEARREWLDRGLLRVKSLEFLMEDTGRTISQAALQYIWSEPAMTCAIPNIYELSQLEEFAAAADVPALTPGELDQINHLYENDFFVAAETAGAF
jgi:aryl-alcohol dehydrogenase-like predicted oxidoreductase